jgi:hypothetical protein
MHIETEASTTDREAKIAQVGSTMDCFVASSQKFAKDAGALRQTATARALQNVGKNERELEGMLSQLETPETLEPPKPDPAPVAAANISIGDLVANANRLDERSKMLFGGPDRATPRSARLAPNHAPADVQGIMMIMFAMLAVIAFGFIMELQKAHPAAHQAKPRPC